MNLGSETHLVKDFLKVQVVAAYVKSQLVEDHLQFILKLSAVGTIDEETSKNRMSKDLIP